MWIKTDEILALGVSRRLIFLRIADEKWQAREVGKSRNGKAIREVDLESLPHELQMKWATMNAPAAFVSLM